jgi:hypothetical protein
MKTARKNEGRMGDRRARIDLQLAKTGHESKKMNVVSKK